MGSLHDITERLPHAICELICINCRHRDIHTFPETAMLRYLECPECKEVGYLIATGQVFDEEEDWYE